MIQKFLNLANTRLSYVLALLAGALLPLAFAPYGLWLFAWLCPAALFLLWSQVEARKAAILGYCFGLGYFGLGVSWVSVSMVRFGGVVMPLAAVLTLLFALVLASYIALAGYLARRYFQRFSQLQQFLVVMPGIWLLTEWLRGWLFTGFPWLALGYSQTDGPLKSLAPIFGVYGVGYVLVLLAGLLCLALLNKAKPRRVYLALIPGVALLGFLFGLITWVEPQSKAISATLLQGNVPQDKKWKAEYRQYTVDLYMRMTREHWASDIIIWPETALPAYFHQGKKLLLGLANEAKQHDSHVLLGLPVLDLEDTSRYYNSMVMAAEPFRFYHKRHLVPFGEFLPFEAMLGDIIRFMDIPMANFSSGKNGQDLLWAGEVPLGISICYEDAFGEEVIQDLPEAQVLVNVSNDAWFGDSFAPHQHLQMARMRSIETGRPMLRATNNGISAIIDHQGKVLGTSKQFKVDSLTGVVQPMQGTTPYVLWGNYFVVIIVTLSLAILLYRSSRPPLVED